MCKIVPELEWHNFMVVDHTILGWVPNPSNIAKLAELIEVAAPKYPIM
jgi:hypothetical protein